MSEHAHEKKRGISGIWNKMYYLVLLCAFVNLLLNQQNGSPRVIGGFGVFNVLTGSMESEIPKGSLVITRKVKQDNLQIGDDITFMVGTATSITHRIVGTIENYNNTGYRGFETKGLENLNKDKDVVVFPNIIGKVVFHNYTLGRVFVFIQTYWLQALVYIVLFAAIRKLLMKVLDGKSQRLEESEESEDTDYTDLEEITSVESVVESLNGEESLDTKIQIDKLLEEIYTPDHEESGIHKEGNDTSAIAPELSNHEELFQQHLEELKLKRTPWYKKLRSKKSGGEK